MKLKILLPNEIFLQEDVQKVSGEAEHGSFTLEPRHIDHAAVLTPGIISYVAHGQERFIAVNEGVIVKKGNDVFISVRDAMTGENLEEMAMTVKEKFEHLEEKEKQARTALDKLEADFTRKYIEWQYS